MFKHLTQQQRYHIEAYKKAGYSNKKIAKDLEVPPSSIGRELKRNSSPIRESYGAASTQEMASLRKSANSKANKKLKNELEDLSSFHLSRDGMHIFLVTTVSVVMHTSL